eukprot:5359911-Prymnesium_polylepis.2
MDIDIQPRPRWIHLGLVPDALAHRAATPLRNVRAKPSAPVCWPCTVLHRVSFSPTWRCGSIGRTCGASCPAPFALANLSRCCCARSSGVAGVAACLPSESLGGCATCSPECGEPFVYRAVVTPTFVVATPVGSPLASCVACTARPDRGARRSARALRPRTVILPAPRDMRAACSRRSADATLAVRQIVVYVAELIDPRRSESEAQSRAPHQALRHV